MNTWKDLCVYSTVYLHAETIGISPAGCLIDRPISHQRPRTEGAGWAYTSSPSKKNRLTP